MTHVAHNPAHPPLHETPQAIPDRNVLRIVGVLFLSAIFAYGLGNGIVQSALAGPDRLASVGAEESAFTLGALLMLGNSVMVASIGVLLLPILARHDKATAYGYFAARIAEALLLALGILALLLVPALSHESATADGPTGATLQTLTALALEGNFLAYQTAMATLGLGSVLFCLLFLRAKLVPRGLALWGVAGYAIFLAGALLELLGSGVGLLLSIPGGLFEVAFGIWLIARGFESTSDQVSGVNA